MEPRMLYSVLVICLVQVVICVRSETFKNGTMINVVHSSSNQKTVKSLSENNTYEYIDNADISKFKSDTDIEMTDYNDGHADYLNHSQEPSAASNVDAQDLQDFLRLYRAFRSSLWYMTVIADPTTAVLGLVGNTLSCIIIYRSGLDKSSNILLFVLGLADCACLLGAINIGNIVSFFPMRLPDGISQWEYPFETSNAFYIVCTLFLTCNYYGIAMSAAVCTLITLERVLAVYLPLHFKTLVTPTRTWVVVTVIALVWLPVYLYMTTLYQLWPYTSASYIFVIRDFTIYSVVDTYLTTPFGGFIPFFIVVIGSILIAIRVKMASRKRQQMQNSSTKVKKSSSRTTRTLLAVCVLFSVTKSIGTVIWFVPIDQSNKERLMVATFSVLFYRYMHYVNSSCNFFIYVGFNDKFGKRLLEMCCRGKA